MLACCLSIKHPNYFRKFLTLEGRRESRKLSDDCTFKVIFSIVWSFHLLRPQQQQIKKEQIAAFVEQS